MGNEIESRGKEGEYIKVSINKKEMDRIPLENAINQEMTIRNIIFKEARKSPEILAVREFFVKINGKRVIPREIKDMSIQDIKTIEIFDSTVDENIL